MKIKYVKEFMMDSNTSRNDLTIGKEYELIHQTAMNRFYIIDDVRDKHYFPYVPYDDGFFWVDYFDVVRE